MTESGLDEVVEAFVGALGAEHLVEFPATALDTVGVPVWATWWSAPDIRGDSSTSGIGYGATEQRARVGALGECVEHVFSRRALAGRTTERGSTAGMRERYGADAVVDPRLLGIPAGTDFDDERPLAWWPLRRLRDGSLGDEQVWAPAELVASSGAELPSDPPAGGWLVTPVTNGLGAGTTLAQAVTHAVLEILQRDGNGLTFRALDTGRVLDLDGVQDPETLAVLARLRDAGVEVLAKVAATDFGLANIDVVGMAPDDDVLAATACGEAVHPDREEALRKAVLEFASARARKQLMHGPLPAVTAIAPPAVRAEMDRVDPAAEEAHVLAAMVEWLRMPRERWEPRLRGTVLREDERVPFTDLPTTRSTSLLDLLEERLAAEGFEVLVCDLSPADGGGVHAAKVRVPGLEVETVAYARLGERNVARLAAAGRDDLVRVGTRPDGWSRVHLAPGAEDRLGGPAWLDTTALAGVARDLYPLYREPGWFAAQHALARER